MLQVASRNSRILFLGTGLPTAKAVIALVSSGHRGKLVALSPSGLLPDSLPRDLAGQLHEVIAWHKLEIKTGHLLRVRRLMKKDRVRALRIEYFSELLGTPAKLETDLVLDFTQSVPKEKE